MFNKYKYHKIHYIYTKFHLFRYCVFNKKRRLIKIYTYIKLFVLKYIIRSERNDIEAWHNFSLRLCVCTGSDWYRNICIQVDVCTTNRSQSVGPETVKENLSLEIETPNGSISLMNPRSKWHGYLFSCLEKKLNGQVQLESACMQLAIRNLLPSSFFWYTYTFQSDLFWLSFFFPQFLLIMIISLGKALSCSSFLASSSIDVSKREF